MSKKWNLDHFFLKISFERFQIILCKLNVYFRKSVKRVFSFAKVSITSARLNLVLFEKVTLSVAS